MRPSVIARLTIVASLSFVIAGCQKTTVTASDGSGYQFTKFTNPAAAVAASQDPTAGPAINANNVRCRKDPACRK